MSAPSSANTGSFEKYFDVFNKPYYQFGEKSKEAEKKAKEPCYTPLNQNDTTDDWGKKVKNIYNTVTENIPSKVSLVTQLPEGAANKLMDPDEVSILNAEKNIEKIQSILSKLEEINKSQIVDVNELVKQENECKNLEKKLNLAEVSKKIKELTEKKELYSNNHIDKSNPVVKQWERINSQLYNEQIKCIDNLDGLQSKRELVLNGETGKIGLVELHKKASEVLDSVKEKLHAARCEMVIVPECELIISDFSTQLKSVKETLDKNFTMLLEFDPVKLTSSFEKNEMRNLIEFRKNFDEALGKLKSNNLIFLKYVTLNKYFKLNKDLVSSHFNELLASKNSNLQDLQTNWNNQCLSLHLLETELAFYKGIVNAAAKSYLFQIEGEEVYFYLEKLETEAKANKKDLLKETAITQAQGAFKAFKERWSSEKFVDLVNCPCDELDNNSLYDQLPNKIKKYNSDGNLSRAKECQNLLQININLKSIKSEPEINALGIVTLADFDKKEFSRKVNEEKIAISKQLSEIITKFTPYHTDPKNIYVWLKAKYQSDTIKPAAGFMGFFYNEDIKDSTLSLMDK
jgi:hypothetical protein